MEKSCFNCEFCKMKGNIDFDYGVCEFDDDRRIYNGRENAKGCEEYQEVEKWKYSVR